MTRPYAFVCYARADERFAAHLGLELRKRGIEIWIDQLDIAPGEPYDDLIRKGLRDAQCVLFLWSRTSAHSPNVKNELEVAKSRGKQIIPVRIEALGPDDDILDLARTQYVDFARDPAFAFEQLAARLAGNMPRTWQLQAVAEGRPNTPTPAYNPSASGTPAYNPSASGTSAYNPSASGTPAYNPSASGTPAYNPGPSRTSLEPTHLSQSTPARRGGGLVIALFGAAIGGTLLLCALIVLASLAPSSQPSSAVAPSGVPSGAQLPAASVEPVAASAIAPELRGAWRGPCVLNPAAGSSQDMFVFRGTDMLNQQTNFASLDCTSNPVFVNTASWRVLAMSALGGGMYAIDFELRRSIVVPLAAQWMNQHQFGGPGVAWVDGVPREVQLFPGVNPGDKLYDTLLLQAGGLYITNDDGKSGRTAETRMQTINTNARFERVSSGSQ